MKKLIALVCALVMALACLPALAEGTDVNTSASTAYYYAATALTGDDLMDAINSFSGFYLVCTTNPDGSANAAFFIYGCKKNEDKYYVQLGLAENQSKQNILSTGKAVAVYAATPGSEEGAKAYAVAGARMTLETVTDADLLKVLNESGSDTVIFMEVTNVVPLG